MFSSTMNAYSGIVADEPAHGRTVTQYNATIATTTNTVANILVIM